MELEYEEDVEENFKSNYLPKQKGKSLNPTSTKLDRPVYVIGGGYSSSDRNLAHSQLKVKGLDKSEVVDTEKSIRLLIDQESKMKNRVKYLEKAQAKVSSRMNVMKAQIDYREKAILKKDDDHLRNALRMKRDEVLEYERRAMV